MGTWTAPAALDALKTRFEAIEDATWTVYTAPVEQFNSADNIIFSRVDGDQSWAAIGAQSKSDSYTIEGSIFCTRKGGGDVIAKAARDAANAILVKVEGSLRSLVTTDEPAFRTAIGATTITALNLANIALNQGSADSARWAQVDFDIQIAARI